MFKNYNLKEIDIDLIQKNPNQPRQVFDDEMIEDLKNSIGEYGIMQPLTVRKLKNKKFELIAGERRLRAAKKLGLKKVPVIINQVDNKDSAVLALVENIQRENLNFIEESLAYEKLIKEYHYTQKALANSLGKSQSTIANKLRLLKLSNNVIKKIKDSQLTERHARALLKIKDDSIQEKVLDEIIENKLNVSRAEQLIDETLHTDTNEIKEVKKKPKKMVQVKKSFKDFRVIDNTIKQTVNVLQNIGLDVDYNVEVVDDFYEVNIKIPIK
ncbi:ParB family chromosome partitioning protein [Natranaerovirga hydrolytica]|uniref:ParB family chromosome partitioning protein n=1 Tax=Natranaerovirga hydrolytica TaxID=680378 RepID=A0A4R1M7F5_9FIRM|nr:ParB/RepB/Spo0J family partition protein [Natranaerovirga hydrolytica]TCK86784.1 ParB family chromosome partitioning protein [Natranaerovirga hydrolytica]